MSLSRKHFNDLATIIADAKNDIDLFPTRQCVINHINVELIRFSKKHNRQFQTDRWNNFIEKKVNS